MTLPGVSTRVLHNAFVIEKGLIAAQSGRIVNGP